MLVILIVNNIDCFACSDGECPFGFHHIIFALEQGAGSKNPPLSIKPEGTAPGAAHDPTVVELLGAVLARLRACGAAPRSGTSQPRRAANHCAIVAHSLAVIVERRRVHAPYNHK